MEGGDSNPTQQQQQPEQQQANHQQQQIQHQQWMAMQYQQQQWIAMQQQQQMMYYMMPPHPYYHPQHYFQHPQQHHPSNKHHNRRINNNQDSPEDNRTLWIGDLQDWMDDSYLQSCFTQTGGGQVFSVKIIRNKQTGQSDGYGFVEFGSHSAAEKVLENFNGTTMPNTDLPFRINWATFSGGDRQPEPGSDSSIFVGDLANDVTDALLHETFATKYPSVKGAKVVMDLNTGRSKGYGFVRFGDENEKSLALTEMNGVHCSSRPMRISVATPKKPAQQPQFSPQGGYAYNQSENDSSNTTIFVGGLDSDVNDEELRQYFTPYGELISVKIPTGKGCGFVQFVDRSSAEDAIDKLNGSIIGKQTVRLSWGRNLGHKLAETLWRTDYNNQWNGGGGYRGSQGHNGYANGANVAYEASSNGHGNNQQQPVN